MRTIAWAFITAAAWLFNLSISAQETVRQAYQADLSDQSLLLDVAQTSNGLLAVGERGHILRSQDGQRWQQDKVPSLSTLTGIASVDGQTWVVGHDATILYQSGPEADWQEQMYQPKLERPLLDVLFVSAEQGIAIGAYGTFFRTLDGGQSWQQEMHNEFLHPDDQAYLEEIRAEDEAFYQEELNSILPHLNRISRSGDRLYLAGESGLLAMSDDLGRSWQRYEVDYQGSFFDIVKAPSGRLLAAGLRGNLFEYDEQAGQWVRLPSSSQASLNSIVPIDQNNTLVLGNNGTLLCMQGEQIQLERLKDSKAIIAAVRFNQSVVAVTGGGILSLTLDQDLPCRQTGGRE